jgi:hypothetical protein
MTVLDAPVTRRLPQTGDELSHDFRHMFPAELAEVPFYCWRALAHVIDELILDARTRGNTPRHPIPEDGKRGGKAPRR